MKKFFDYKDVVLVPKKGIVSSRRECDTTFQLGNYSFEFPACAANMKSVVDKDTCMFFSKKGWFYIYHRFHEDYINRQINFCKYMHSKGMLVSISIGVKDEDYELVDKLCNNNINVHYITIDVAHGHSFLVENMIDYVKAKLDVFLIVGNVCTKEAVKDLEKWGADCIKVGIGPGSPCTSSAKTGVGSRGWQLSCVRECSGASNVPVIADGGIKEHGDIAKAISCGATFVMAGSLFSGYEESSGNVIEIEDRMYKEYYGSASKYNKNEQKNIEGKKTLIPYKGRMEDLLRELKEDLQSSISYVGANSLDGLGKSEIYIIK